MKPLSAKQIANIISARCKNSSALGKTICRGISTDTRTIKKEDCFFALKGENFDGASFTQQAAVAGACCVVVTTGSKAAVPEDVAVLEVPDTLLALGQLAAHYRLEQDFKLIAITGSVGKTTTRHIIAHVLASKFRVHQSPKNFNNLIGLPITLLTAEPDDQIVIAELGTNQPGEIERLSRIAAPDIAVVTNVCPAHLEGFGCIENIAIEKMAIRLGLRKNANFIYSADYPSLSKLVPNGNCKLMTFGFTPTADILGLKIAYSHNYSEFEIENQPVHLPLPGPGNLQNTLAAYAACKTMGITAKQFADAVKSISPIDMRAQNLTIGRLTVISDCYNANPASMKNALHILSGCARQNSNRTVFICGHMGELGEQSEKLHQQLGRDIAEAKVDLLLAVGPLAETVAHTALNFSNGKIITKTFAHAGDVCDYLQDFIKETDIILVKGSRSAKLEQAVDRIRELFDRDVKTGCTA